VEAPLEGAEGDRELSADGAPAGSEGGGDGYGDDPPVAAVDGQERGADAASEDAEEVSGVQGAQSGTA
jgi:hypothetical protein